MCHLDYVKIWIAKMPETTTTDISSRQLRHHRRSNSDDTSLSIFSSTRTTIMHCTLIKSSTRTSTLIAIMIIAIVVGCLANYNSVNAARRRCFYCRSRGPLGDCKDQFEFNSTTASSYGSFPVEVQPCASGWCGKTIEDEDEGAHIIATERMCLQRPPSDGKERCSKTFYSNRKKTFYMCFCKGDLCNAGGGSFFTVTSAPTIFSITGLVILFTLYILNA